MVPCPTCYLLYSSLTYQKAHRLTPSKAICETQKPWLTIATKGVVHFQMKTPWFEGVFWGWCIVLNDRVEWQIPRVELWSIISVVGALSLLACIPQLLWWQISLYIFSIMLQILFFPLYQRQPQLYNLWTLWMTGSMHWALTGEGLRGIIHHWGPNNSHPDEISIFESLRTAWC